MSDLVVQTGKVDYVTTCELKGGKTGFNFEFSEVPEDSVLSIIEQIYDQYGSDFITSHLDELLLQG